MRGRVIQHAMRGWPRIEQRGNDSRTNSLLPERAHKTGWNRTLWAVLFLCTQQRANRTHPTHSQ